MHTLGKNTGLLIGDRPTDYRFGSTSLIKHEVRNSTRDWKSFRSRDERQNMNPEDRMYCVTGSATNIWEQQANWMLINNLWPVDALKFWNTRGYIVNGKFEISRRFTAKMSGTTREGNYFYKVWDSIRNDGIAPDSLYPDNQDLSWDEYYRPIESGLILLAKESLKYFSLLYESIAGTSMATLKIMQEMAPLQFGVSTACGWDAEVPPCGGPPNHAVDNDHIRVDNSYNIFDSYDPYSKHIPAKYPVPFLYRAVLYPINRAEPVAPVEPTPGSYTFTKDMVYGETSQDVAMLQKYLKMTGTTGYYGTTTAQNVQKLMIAQNLGSWWEKYIYPAGKRVGPKIRAFLNK